MIDFSPELDVLQERGLDVQYALNIYRSLPRIDAYGSNAWGDLRDTVLQNHAQEAETIMGGVLVAFEHTLSHRPDTLAVCIRVLQNLHDTLLSLHALLTKFSGTYSRRTGSHSNCRTKMVTDAYDLSSHTQEQCADCAALHEKSIYGLRKERLRVMRDLFTSTNIMPVTFVAIDDDPQDTYCGSICVEEQQHKGPTMPSPRHMPVITSLVVRDDDISEAEANSIAIRLVHHALSNALDPDQFKEGDLSPVRPLGEVVSKL